MTLDFPSERFVHDPASATVRFTAMADLIEMVPCIIDEKTLLELQHAPAGSENVIPIFVRHRGLIQAAAEEKFRRGRREADGSVHVEWADLLF